MGDNPGEYFIVSWMSLYCLLFIKCLTHISLFSIQSEAPTKAPTVPTISPAPTTEFGMAQATEDTFIRGGSNSGNVYGDNSIIMVKEDSNASYDRKGLLKFSITPNEVLGKKLYLRLHIRYLGDTSLSGVTVTHVDNNNWAEGTATWANYQYNRLSSATPAFACSLRDVGTWISIDVGDIMKPYLSSVSGSDEVLVTLLLEKAGSPHGQNYVQFASSENGVGAYTPKLTWETIMVGVICFMFLFSCIGNFIF